VEREFRSTMIHQAYIEPAAATATWSSGGTLTVHSSTQGSFTMRGQIAELLKMPESRIRVIPTEVGGAFGGKINTYVEVPSALLSRKSGRPVKTVMERHEVFTSTGPTSGAVMRIKMAADSGGRLVAATAELCYEAGAFPGSPADSAASNIFAVYDIPAGRIDGYDVVVNKPRTTPYRAPGLTNAVWAAEQVVDEIATRLNMDPVALRSANCAKEGTKTISGMTHKSIGCREVLEALQATEHYKSALTGPNRGRGVAVGHWGNWGAQSSAAISVNFDGTVSLVSGSVDLTGTRTSLAMIAADVLGIPLDSVSAIVGDTASVGYTQVTAGSRTTTATSRAVTIAAEEVLIQMKKRAAAVWEVPSDKVIYQDGAFQAQGHSLTFAELAGELESTGGPVAGVGTIDVTDWGGVIGAHIADVEVDPETGKVKVIRYSVVQDVGRAIHPGQIEGQMHGGVAQGIGWALYEGYQWDAEGHVLNANLLDYKLPTALDIPFIETHIVEVPYPAHPLGIRGVGEVPIVHPAAAVANAIHAATGARVTELPMTPGRVREAGRSV
ncbi:MAG: xanthine dehydrogenase family protein molybdopterin-binding subunit, partial [Spirochaetales bacterium]